MNGSKKKIQPIVSSLEENQNNWEETFYQSVASAYGGRVNAEPFRMLARALPLKILAKHKNNLFQLEALLFGTAGFLNENFTDDYPNALKKEFDFLQKKYALEPLKKHIWRFLRLRPANFPTLRMAQFAQLIFKSTALLSKTLEATDSPAMVKLFACTASEYWNDHYRFDKISSRLVKSMGEDSIQLLLINTIAPFLFVYGKIRDEEEHVHQALRLLENLPPEKNATISNWMKTGVAAQSAFDSQALLQLKNNYCKNFRCLECGIGHKILAGNR